MFREREIVMAYWNIDWLLGVTICFDENETKNVLNASDVPNAIGSAIGAAPPPVGTAGQIIAAWISFGKGQSELVHQGNGVCYAVPWAAIAVGPAAWTLVIPTPNPAVQAREQQHVNY